MLARILMMQRTSDIFRVIVRRAHNKASNNNGPRIYLSKDETCFVSYHPQAEHPYEDTRPLPKAEKLEESYLKVDATNMITKAPNLDQLQDLTYTPKAHWKDFSGRAKRLAYKASFNDNIDRKGLTT